MQSIRVHTVTLWRAGQLWRSAFLSEADGSITLYPCSPSGEIYTPATLPPGVKVCPNLALTHDWSPKRAQDAARAAALRYGYEIFEIDIVPW